MAKTVGELNGRWSLLFRVLLTVAVPFCAYMVITQHCLDKQMAELRESAKARDMRLANIEDANKEQWKAMNEVQRYAQKNRDMAEQNKSEIDRLRAGG